jgi:radical SAM superfamily enzyme YgiQ (UPF0313 family)
METEVPLFRCLGILALSAALKRKEIDVDVLDLSSVSVGVASDFDAILKDTLDAISSSGPDVLGLSTMSNNIVVALEICRRVKKKHPEIVTILGGPGASFSADRIMASFNYVDIIIRGEADSAFPELIEQMQNDGTMKLIKGVIYREEDKIIDSEWPEPIADLDSLPIPDYESCSADVAIDEPVTLEVGRGCPFACTFCSTSSFFKRKFRVKSVNRIIEEISLVQRRFGNRRIKMNHDLLTFNRDYIISLCDALTELDTPIQWGCSARLDTLDEEMLITLKHAGCDRIYLGIETMTSRMQQIINKRLNLNKLEDILETAIGLDFKLILSFVIGFPEETQTDIEALWSFIFYVKSTYSLKINTQVHSVVPEPGSKLFEMMKESLVYDDYGGPGHSDFPPISWTYLRKMIRTNPDIFPTYFYINSPTMQRQNILKQVFLGNIVNGPATCSLQFAYSVLGNGIVNKLIENIAIIDLPKPNWPVVDYRDTMESVRRIVLDLFDDEDSRLQYDSIATAEITMHDIRKDKDHHEFIDVEYHPIQLMKKITGLEFDSSQLDKRSRTLLIFWDEKTNGIGYMEMSDNVTQLRKKSKC